jgi:hypothetical protein
MLVLVGVAGLVVDLAALRLDRQADVTAADAAAVNGAYALDPMIGGSPQAGCTKAWTYLADNLSDLPSGATFPCTSFATSSSCTNSTTAGTSVSEVVGNYTITMETPVPDSDPLMVDPTGEPVQLSHDGTACQRFGVLIAMHQNFLFGRAVGVGSGNTTTRAVARYSLHQGNNFPALTALDPHACPGISAGGGFIEAFSASDATTGQSSPGLIYADSDGAGYSGGGGCNRGSNVVIEVNGSNNGGYTYSPSTCSALPSVSAGIIWAQCTATDTGVIGTYALSTANSGVAYKPGYNYFPTPTAMAQPITREPVDALYHCSNVSSSYGIACTDDAINDLNTAYASVSSTTPGWTVVTTCSVTGTLTLAADTFVDCPDSGNGGGGFTIKGGTVTISAGGPVVFAGSINFSSQGGNLWVVASGATQGDTNLGDYANAPDSIVYLQNSGSLTTTSGSSVVLPHTLVYSGSGSNGCLNIVSGSTVAWSAVASSSDKYRKLMFWSEGSCNAGGGTKASTFDGGAALTMDGILFSPNANWTITGNSSVDARNVQFWVNTISVSSNSSGLLLRPDPDNAVPVAGGVELIR